MGGDAEAPHRSEETTTHMQRERRDDAFDTAMAGSENDKHEYTTEREGG